ncbi:hypothetical protein TYRP_001579 [Tyrophagus putrescentiae]|nr:hypothetical protein TYRP_001579 [Tyrophagus putrescentiae]
MGGQGGRGVGGGLYQKPAIISSTVWLGMMPLMAATMRISSSRIAITCVTTSGTGIRTMITSMKLRQRAITSRMVTFENTGKNLDFDCQQNTQNYQPLTKLVKTNHLAVLRHKTVKSANGHAKEQANEAILQPSQLNQANQKARLCRTFRDLFFRLLPESRPKRPTRSPLVSWANSQTQSKEQALRLAGDGVVVVRLAPVIASKSSLNLTIAWATRSKFSRTSFRREQLSLRTIEPKSLMSALWNSTSRSVVKEISKRRSYMSWKMVLAVMGGGKVGGDEAQLNCPLWNGKREHHVKLRSACLFIVEDVAANAHFRRLVPLFVGEGPSSFNIGRSRLASFRLWYTIVPKEAEKGRSMPSEGSCARRLADLLSFAESLLTLISPNCRTKATIIQLINTCTFSATADHLLIIINTRLQSPPGKSTAEGTFRWTTGFVQLEQPTPIVLVDAHSASVNFRSIDLHLVLLIDGDRADGGQPGGPAEAAELRQTPARMREVLAGEQLRVGGGLLGKAQR